MSENWQWGMTETTVSANPGDWDQEQQRKAALYGMCGLCGAPRDVAAAEIEAGVFRMEFECLNGHRGPGV